MSSEKKIWKKPELTAFSNADEAIASYSKHGMHAHVEAVKKLRAEAEHVPPSEAVDEFHVPSLRKVGRR